MSVFGYLTYLVRNYFKKSSLFSNLKHALKSFQRGVKENKLLFGGL